LRIKTCESVVACPLLARWGTSEFVECFFPLSSPTSSIFCFETPVLSTENHSAFVPVNSCSFSPLITQRLNPLAPYCPPRTTFRSPQSLVPCLFTAERPTRPSATRVSALVIAPSDSAGRLISHPVAHQLSSSEVGEGPL